MPIQSLDSGRRLAPLAAAIAGLATAVVLLLPAGDAGGAPTGAAAAKKTRGAPTGGASPTSPCREVTCTVSFAVGSKVKRWRSPEVFFPANEQVLAKLVASKSEATLLKSYGAALCKHRFYGSAMSILVTACGPQSQISLRAVRLKRGLRRLTITYAADPYMSDEGAGRSNSLYQGLTALTGLSW
jgi:hypothetical protein